MSKLRVLISNTFNPWFNLATEDYMDPECKVLFLWRNEPTVVIGKFQNPWSECHTEAMKKDGIHLARRQSGGGAVFHDLGNTNFTLMSGGGKVSKKENNTIICNAIARFGIKAYASGRNDILVDDNEGPKKISGSAFKQTKDRSFHHGTLLIDANLEKLIEYLSPSKKKLASKAIASVRSRVTNLSELNSVVTHDSLCAAIIEEFKSFYDRDCEIEVLEDASLAAIEKLDTYYQRMKDWNWRFGETPKFSHSLENRFTWGEVQLHIDVAKGSKTNTKLFSDSLHPDMIELLQKNLIGVAYTVAGISECVSKTKAELPMIAQYLEEFETWISAEIS